MSLFVHQTTVLSRFTFRATRDLFSVLSGATINGTAPALANGRACALRSRALSVLSESEGQLTFGDGKVSAKRLRVELQFDSGSQRLFSYAEKRGTRLFRFTQAGACGVLIHARARRKKNVVVSLEFVCILHAYGCDGAASKILQASSSTDLASMASSLSICDSFV